MLAHVYASLESKGGWLTKVWRKVSRRLAGGLALSATACGMFPNDQAHEDAALRNIRARVAFDLGCERPELVRLGDVARLGQQMTRMNIGAKCPEKRATYTVTCVSNMGDISCTPELNSTQ